MGAIIIEHVRIEEETDDAEVASQAGSSTPSTENPLFGLWRDREDMTDVEGYIRKLRAPRF